MQIYVVQAEDNIDKIARRYGVSVESVIYNNQLVYPYRLAVGQALLLSTGGEREEHKSTWINGYAYPFISPWVLTQTLPYLSQLSVFSYGFTEQGDLVPPVLDDTWMVGEAWKRGTVPALTLTPLGADGRFDNVLIGKMINNPSAKQRLSTQLLDLMKEKGFGAIDVDFEYILAQDRVAYAEFIRELTAVMNQAGYPLSVALAPKLSGNQPGVLYEGMDYALLGAAANWVLLMTYEWGYTYGPNLPVAPINMVRQVVEYAVTQIPREKISLGIPNYGYDWALPFEPGVTKARTIGNVEAVQLAIQYGAVIQFDETAQTPFFWYWDNQVMHEVWFEDVRSMKAKFALIDEFGLRGAGYWQIMQLFRANWLLLADTFQIKKL